MKCFFKLKYNRKWKEVYPKTSVFLLSIFLIYFLVLWVNFLRYHSEIRANQSLIQKLEQEELERKEKEQELLLQKQILINNLDLKTDSSLTKFVSSNIHFDDISYIPEDLVNISWDYIYDAKWGYQLLRKEAKDALDKMALDFYRAYEKKLVVVSSYRSYNYQKGIKNRGCPDNLCAKAWYSEHQSWLAIDLWEATTKNQFLSKAYLKDYFEWLNNNAYKYWFHNTYQKWLEVDTYEIEPWHWRYVWVELATYLHENSLTFAEYYNKKNNPKW